MIIIIVNTVCSADTFALSCMRILGGGGGLMCKNHCAKYGNLFGDQFDYMRTYRERQSGIYTQRV